MPETIASLLKYTRHLEKSFLESSKILPKLVQIHCIKPLVPWYKSHTHKKKKNLQRNDRLISKMNTDAQILDRMATNHIQQYIKTITFWGANRLYKTGPSQVSLKCDITH